MNFNDKLYDLRKKSGMSQEQLAEKLNVSRQAVSKWETGEAFPEAPKILAIARLFDVTADYLIDDTQEQFTKPADNEKIAGTEKAVISIRAALGKYGWIIGILIAALGIKRLVTSLLPIVSFCSAANISGDYGFIVVPLFYAFGGLIVTAAGVFVIVKFGPWKKNK